MDMKKLLEVMERLRSENGCPWDKEQTRESLEPFLVEETYEVIEAIDEGDVEKIKEELGDLLFQIVFHCQIAKERGEFDFYDVVNTITEKMINRHPHVFGGEKVGTAKEVLIKWEEQKKKEGKDRNSILEGIPKTLPALLMAHRLQEKVSRVGFDWKELAEVIEKFDEELMEFRAAIKSGDKGKIEEELGDLFFVLVNLSRFLETNPEVALRRAIQKFIKRFQYIEAKASESGKKLSNMSLSDMDRLWEEAKGLQ
ncbi:MAG: nucleoside triphosphate pyrophosphohydrolase [Nitrospirae bacterium]|nr:MAG: nucleoside triphosphate pyrophosphohydrolase [Nitrospirota bacterium]